MLALSGLGQRRRRRGRWSSTRSTPGSAATRRARSASGCGRWPTGRQVHLHHPPAPGRLAGRDPLPDREARRGGRGSGDGRAGRAARSWSPRSSACSAPTAATRRRAATRASCSRPPERRVSAVAPRGRPTAGPRFRIIRPMALRNRARALLRGRRNRARARRGGADRGRARAWAQDQGPGQAARRRRRRDHRPRRPRPDRAPRTWRRAGCRRWSTSRRRRPAATRTRARCCSPAPGCRWSTRPRRPLFEELSRRRRDRRSRGGEVRRNGAVARAWQRSSTLERATDADRASSASASTRRWRPSPRTRSRTSRRRASCSPGRSSSRDAHRLPRPPRR